MDKTLMRARMKEAAKKKEKRITSPLVRYNDLDQAVCKICNVVVKSEVLWNPHLASRAHKEAAEKFKARAAKVTQEAAKPQIPAPAITPSPAEPASALPADFFDSSSAPNTNLPSDFFDTSSAPSAKRARSNDSEQSTKASTPAHAALTKPKTQNGSMGPPKAAPKAPPPVGPDNSTSKVPEGFFDNVDADHRARGLEPPKIDIKEEYKEFQKSIKENLMEAEVQQEEDEEEAADVREGFEEIEQRTFTERVEMLRKVKEERVAKSKAENAAAFPAVMGIEADNDSDDSDDDDATYFDWRAKEI